MQSDEPASPGDPQPADDHPGEQEGASSGEERFLILDQQKKKERKRKIFNLAP